MLISGFSYARNADTLGYPFIESIRSILPICDEFIIAVGKGNPGDKTCEMINAINDPKIQIIDTEWNIGDDRPLHHVFREQTDIALRECKGNWCFHIQIDEVVHENDLALIKTACGKYLQNPRVEGMLLEWYHFWGDYNHLQVHHRYFAREIRIIRNCIGVSSWGDSQSFRINSRKLAVVSLAAHIYHYAMTRHPRLMRIKQQEADKIYDGVARATQQDQADVLDYDYGPMNRYQIFKGTHPLLMRERIESMDWAHLLQPSGKRRFKHHHDRLKYRILNWIEKYLFGGHRLGGYKNYRVIRIPKGG
jgi:hypothetical protein